MLKRKCVRLITVLTVLVLLSACAKLANTQESMESTAAQSASKAKVVVTTSFLEDMVYQIAKDTVDISLIIPAGEDPHVYTAKPEDYEKLQQADLLLYHGLHFEGNMMDALEEKGVAVSAHFPQEKLGKMEEDGEVITDPHFWFDLSLYQMAVEEAAASLIALKPDMEKEYSANKEAYIAQLKELDIYIRENISAIPKESRYLITPHDAFNYFAANYDIEVKAPQGVSTESEVSAKDIQETVDFIVEHKVKAVFAESTTDPARMQKLQEAAAAQGHTVKIVSGEGQELYSDSLAPKGQEGDTFISMYKHNVDLIHQNLK